MIVRILGDGRYDVPEADLPAIDELDSVLVDALDRRDEITFAGALADLVGEVRHSGVRLSDDDLRTSEMVVPHEGSTLSEVADLLASEP